MKPKTISKQNSLYSVPLKAFVDPLHELVLLALILNWKALEAKFGAHFKPEKGRPPVATRVMVGLHLLKYLYDESDESVVARVSENPYWQHFCGFVEFQHMPPCDASSLTRWRRKVGGDGEAVLRASLAGAKAAGMAKAEDFQRAVLDTTVQTKAVTPPTDGKLLCAMHGRLAGEAVGTIAARPAAAGGGCGGAHGAQAENQSRQGFVCAAQNHRRADVRANHGQIKRCMGFRQFSLRGKVKVKGEWSLVCTAHNLLKLHQISLRLESG